MASGPADFAVLAGRYPFGDGVFRVPPRDRSRVLGAERGAVPLRFIDVRYGQFDAGYKRWYCWEKFAYDFLELFVDRRREYMGDG